MPTLYIRNVPEGLYEHILRQAQEQNRSISAQVIHLLERAVLESPQVQRQVLERIQRRRSEFSFQPGVPDSLKLLRQDRER
jgi:plasmid stability protein